jgi:cell division protein FtsQ
LLAAVLVLGVLLGALWTVFVSSSLAVSGVRVDGAAVLEPRTVRRAAAVPLGEPLATVDLDAVAARVEQLAAVKSVDVSRSWPDRVRIAVTERPTSLPLLRMGERTGADALAEAARVAGVLPAGIARRVDYVEVRTVDTISLRLRNGRTVRWGSADESDSKAKVLAVLLGQKASLYDVTVPGRPIIRK